MSRPPLYTRRPFLAGLLRQLPLLVGVRGRGALVTFEHWRRGLVVVGLALVGGRLLRLVLPSAGRFLAVRSRPVDVVLLAAPASRSARFRGSGLECRTAEARGPLPR
jgi:hypothetical protein